MDSYNFYVACGETDNKTIKLKCVPCKMAINALEKNEAGMGRTGECYKFRMTREVLIEKGTF